MGADVNSHRDFTSEALRQAVILAGVALIPAVFSAFFHPHKPSWNIVREDEISVSTLSGLRSSVLWVDARAKPAYEKEHIPGALLLNEDAWDDLIVPILQVWTPDRIVIVYCGRQDCQASHEVAQRLRDQLGLKPVYVLKGGWEAWQVANK